MSTRRSEGDPGWSFSRVATLFLLGILVGAFLGAVAGLVIAVIGEYQGFVPFATFVGGMTGAVIATVAALGSVSALVITDRWAEKTPAHRIRSAGIGATVSVAGTAVLLVFLSNEEVNPHMLVPVAATSLAAGLAASTGLGLFERARTGSLRT